MDTSDALRILRSLADGVDPHTGDVFAPESPYQRAEVVRALFAAVHVLEKASANASAPRSSEMAAPIAEPGRNLDAARGRLPVHKFHPVLITEVTRMLHDHFCIAGYDLHAHKMVRPLRPKGENWVFDEFQPPYRPGQLVNAKGSSRPDGMPPHSLEDRILNGAMDVLEEWSGPELCAAMHPFACQTITQLFDRRPLENRYVIEGTECRSLGGVTTVRKCIKFRPSGNGRLRLHFEDADGELYILPVTCDRLRTLYDPDGGRHGVEGANRWLASMPEDGAILLRLGLTRGYAGNDGEFNPKRCYVQVNGILSAHPPPECD